MDENAEIFRVSRTWIVAPANNREVNINVLLSLIGKRTKKVATNKRRSSEIREYRPHLSIYSNPLEVVVDGGLAPTPCEWSQVAKDICDCISVVNTTEKRDATVKFSACTFLATTPSCPGWQALLEQLSRIGAHASSLRVTFHNCTFAGAPDLRQAMVQGLRPMNAADVVFADCSLKRMASLRSEQMTTRLHHTQIELFRRHETEGDLPCSFNVTVANNEHPNGCVRWEMAYASPTSRLWQLIAAITANSTTNKSNRMDFCFKMIRFRHSAGLETFLETMAGMGVDRMTETIRRRLRITLQYCSFLDAEAQDRVETVIAVNKAVDMVDLDKVDSRPFCDMLDLLSQSTTLSTVKFVIPCDLECQKCIRKSLAASTGLVSVRMILGAVDRTDYTQFIRGVRNAIVAAAYKTRGKYRDWFTVPAEALPYLCEYVQFDMPRMIVTVTAIFGGRELYKDEEGSTELYGLTVLYDLLQSRSSVLRYVGDKSAVVARVANCGKRKREQIRKRGHSPKVYRRQHNVVTR